MGNLFLNKFFIHFSQISIHFYFVFIFEDLLTEELKKIFLPKLKKLKKEEKLEKYLFYLTQETRGSGIFQEKIALLKIASVIYRNKKWRALFKKGKVRAIEKAVLKDPLGKRILAHQKKYLGLHSYFFYVKEYNLRDIIKGIKEELAINPQKTLNNLIGSQEELEKIQKQILKEVKLEKGELKILKLAQAYGYFRNIRIGQIGSSQVLIKPILAEWAKRLKLTYEEIIYLTSQETLSGVFDKKKLKERKKGYIYLLEKGQQHLITGRARAKFLKEEERKEEKGRQKIIKGSSAFPGKVKGKVKLANAYTFNQLKRGDILVCGVTIMEAVPYIKRCRAIITNEGGITCHAAIAARELKIPCIVGTKIATQIFKDGDRVEVDANKGIVKILKK